MDRAVPVKDEIGRYADAVCQPLGLEVVAVSLGRTAKRWQLRIDIDRPGPSGIGIDDCQGVSRALEAILDDKEIIPCSYTLEVSSPGIDRPIKTDADIRRNTGRKIVVEILNEQEGRRTYKGILLGKRMNILRLLDSADPDREIEIEVSEIVQAKQEVPF